MARTRRLPATEHLCAECGIGWPDAQTAAECARLDLVGVTVDYVIERLRAWGRTQRVPAWDEGQT